MDNLTKWLKSPLFLLCFAALILCIYAWFSYVSSDEEKVESSTAFFDNSLAAHIGLEVELNSIRSQINQLVLQLESLSSYQQAYVDDLIAKVQNNHKNIHLSWVPVGEDVSNDVLINKGEQFYLMSEDSNQAVLFYTSSKDESASLGVFRFSVKNEGYSVITLNLSHLFKVEEDAQATSVELCQQLSLISKNKMIPLLNGNEANCSYSEFIVSNQHTLSWLNHTFLLSKYKLNDKIALSFLFTPQALSSLLLFLFSLLIFYETFAQKH